MTGYTSGKTYRDPHPWIGDPGHTNTPNRYGFRETGEGAPFWDDVQHAPRPEFDNHNAVLAALRKNGWDAAKTLRALDRDPAWCAQFPTAHQNHARRVLEKLAALS